MIRYRELSIQVPDFGGYRKYVGTNSACVSSERAFCLAGGCEELGAAVREWVRQGRLDELAEVDDRLKTATGSRLGVCA
jgi:hypothetical protein